MVKNDYNPATRGTVFDIQRFSVHDGPGIRTLVFLKGCPLRCLWCSNPESLAAAPQLGFSLQNCIGCGRCFEVCPTGAIIPGDERVDRAKCVVCGQCAAACAPKALTVIGRDYTVEEVMAEIKRDTMFYRRSGGGVTFSGGEPLAQPEFLGQLLRAVRSNYLHSAIETTGYASEGVIREIFPQADLILYDIKQMDPVKHEEFTGVSNQIPLAHAQLAVSLGVPIIIRVPVIPGHNDSEENIRETCRFARDIGVREIHLLPYHRLGQGKYKKLGRDYPLEGLKPLPPEAMENLSQIVKSFNLSCTLGG